MARRKLAISTLQNRKTRMALFERRKKGLLKKASELSTLCGIDTCVIIFPPPDSENLKVETFPQDPTDVIHRFQGCNTKKQKKKNYDLREFFNDMKKKVESETSKVIEQRLNMMCPTWDDSFDNMGEDQLRMFVSALDCKILECNQTIGLLLKEKESDMPVIPMGFMQNDNCLEIPVTVISPHDVSDEAHLDFISALDSDLLEGNNQMIDMFKMKSLDDLCMGTPLVTLPDISNQSYLSFLQNTLLDDNLFIGPMKPLSDSTSNGMIESHCLQDQAFHSGLGILI